MDQESYSSNSKMMASNYDMQMSNRSADGFKDSSQKHKDLMKVNRGKQQQFQEMLIQEEKDKPLLTEQQESSSQHSNMKKDTGSKGLQQKPQTNSGKRQVQTLSQSNFNSKSPVNGGSIQLETPLSTSSKQQKQNPINTVGKRNQKNSNFNTFNGSMEQNYSSTPDANLYGSYAGFSGSNNGNNVSYSQSLQFYEAQYREKLKELDQEKKNRRMLEEKVEDVESNLRDYLEENAKLKDDLKECVSDNNILTMHFQQMQEQQRAAEPYANEVEDRNIKLNLEIFSLKEEMKILQDDKQQMIRKNAFLLQQIEEIQKENHKWKEQHDQLKERMQTLRQVNKQLENKASQNWVMLRRNDIFKENEERMIKGEQRVKELEDSLSQFIEDFETLNSDLTVCAQKLALAESRVELLTRKNSEMDSQNAELIDKIAKVKKPPPKTVQVSLCAHYEGQGKAFNPEELMKILETQNLQILTLTKTLDGLRKENREYFQKTLEQQEIIFNLQSKVSIFENVPNSNLAGNANSYIYTQKPIYRQSEQTLKFEYSQSNNQNNDSQSPNAKHFSLSSSQDTNMIQQMMKKSNKQIQGGQTSYASSVNEIDNDNETNRGSNTMKSAVKEFSFKNSKEQEQAQKSSGGNYKSPKDKMVFKKT